MFGSLIEDGYTEKGFIAPEPGSHSGLRFTYRPLLTHLRSKFFALVGKRTPEEQDLKSAELLGKQLVSWDLKDSKGKSVALSETHIRCLKPKVFGRVFSIVVGSEASDIDPEWTAEDTAKHADEQLDSMMAELSPGASRELSDAKNSRPG